MSSLHIYVYLEFRVLTGQSQVFLTQCCMDALPLPLLHVVVNPVPTPAGSNCHHVLTLKFVPKLMKILGQHFIGVVDQGKCFYNYFLLTRAIVCTIPKTLAHKAWDKCTICLKCTASLKIAFARLGGRCKL